GRRIVVSGEGGLKKLGHVPALDGVRGLAVMLVVLFHFGLFGMGWIGVELFFVLSGFLITRLLLERKNTTLGRYLKQFYWRRILRIFPLYFGFLFVSGLIYFSVGLPGISESQFPYLLTYTLNIAATFYEWQQDFFYTYLWSLSGEEQFYLLWPLLVFFLNRRWLFGLSLIIILLSPVIRWQTAEWLADARGTTDLLGAAVYYFPVGRFDGFAMGALVATGIWPLLFGRPKRFLLIAGLLLISTGAANFILHLSKNPDYFYTSFGFPIASIQHGLHVWGYTVLNLFFGALIIIAIAPQGHVFGRWFSAKWIRQIGKVSYGIYIFHFPLFLLFAHFIPLYENLWLRLICFLPYFAIVYGVSWFSYGYYESYFLKMKGKWSKKLST
ncbi:MAG: acyltransferase, partial [Bacteroidota bacterium]